MKSNIRKISSLAVLLAVVFLTFCFGASTLGQGNNSVSVKFKYGGPTLRPKNDSVGVRFSYGGPTLSQKNDIVAMRFSSFARIFQIKDLRNGLVWTSDPIDDGVELVKALQGKEAIELELRDKATDAIFNAAISLGDGAEVNFELSAGEEDVWPAKLGAFPPLFTADINDGSLLVTDRNSGMLIDQKDNVYSGKVLNVYGAHTCLTMPFTGIVTPDGRGLMVMFDTPADAAIKMVKKEDDIHWPAVQWRSSMQKFNYTRKVVYKLFDKGGYVAIAKDYRQYLIKKGQFKTLAQKASERPKVEWLKGAPVIWGWPYDPNFHNEAFNYGITRGIANSLIGVPIEKEDIDLHTQNGWLAGRYENWSDITESWGADIEEEAVIPSPGAEPRKGWLGEDGTQFYTRSSAIMLELAQSIVPAAILEYGYTQYFLDVVPCVDLTEDYHPEHTYDRREDMQNRRSFCQYHNDLGMVVRGEFGNAWAVDKVDAFEGSMSSNTFQSWNHHLNFPEPGSITDRYRKYAMGYDIKIPLWQLVFHDCVVDTWWWGNSAGFLYDQAPELSTRKDLFNILYGTVPLLWYSDDKGYGWDRNRDRFMQTYQVTCKLHEEIAFDDMLNHEYSSNDKLLQKTTFSSGANVVVNFGNAAKDYTYGANTVKIAPEGFFVHGIDMQQSKLIEDGKTVTRIIKDGYQVLDVTGGQVQIGAITLDGKIAAFKVNDNRWNLFLTSGKTYEIDLPALTGWNINSDFEVSFMNDKGDKLNDVPVQITNGKITYLAAADLDMIMVTR